MRDFPLRFFVRFFDNHGMLLPGTRPQWLTITGGSQRYIDAMLPAFRDRVRRATPVRSVRRHSDHVELTVQPLDAPPQIERFDHVILACHSDQALHMLADPSAAEREILGAIPYSENQAVLHTDRSLMPRQRRAWAAWNYHLTRDDPGRAVLTYNMTRLQSLPIDEPLCVTLNRTATIDPKSILRSMTYHHPSFSLAGIAAQHRREEISGVNRTSYAGAYWFNGFHEDGVRSALEACKPFGAAL
jgi:predicted NAD/FAD-binding protein